MKIIFLTFVLGAQNESQNLMQPIPNPMMLQMKFDLDGPAGLRDFHVWMCERTDGPRREFHHISSLGAFGSDELKMKTKTTTKKQEALKCYWTQNTDLLNATDSLLSIRLSRNYDFFPIQISKAHFLWRFPEIGWNVFIEYSYF